MKKSYMPISDVKNESLDLTKRLYRSIGDVVRTLDDQRQKANSISDLFTHTAEAQRMKLREYCERLMFFDPVGFGRKGEELLWRKGYYEVVTTAKRLHKGPLWKPLEVSYLRSHLQAGIGHYHHLLLRLQIDFRMDLRGIVDFPYLVADIGLKKGKSSSTSKEKSLDSGAVDWANLAVHRCLIYLGDLGRYLADLCPGYHTDLPARYYHQALYWKPDCGMPHNQLGTLVGNYNFFLDSAYHYMRCLMSSQSFEGTESNLAGVLERSWKHFESTLTPSPLHHLISKFLNIVDFCYFDKQPPECFPQLCHEAIDRLNSYQEMLQTVTLTNGEETNDQPGQLTDDILFKLTLVSLMCTQQLQNKGSDQMNIVLAITLAMMNYLIVKVVERLEEVLPPPQAPPLAATNGHSKRRRRRRRRRDSSELSSDMSDGEVVALTSDSELSEEELVFDAQSSDSDSECDENEQQEEAEVVDPRKLQLGETPAVAKSTVLDHIEQLCQNGFLLQTIKVCLDWLLTNVEVLRACAQSAKPMLGRTAHFLNHLTQVPLPPPASEQPDVINNGILENERTPLVEEVSVRGLVALKPAYQHIEWTQLKSKCLTPRQEAYIRVCKLVQLGKRLASSGGSEITYDQTRKWFQLNASEPPPECNVQPENDIKTKKNKLMSQLWLKDEVQKLESKIRHTSPLPPYLVLDCDALTYHITLVKQLVHSKKFIILIPSIVVSSLDEQKRVSRRARDTIRWLEAQFRQGNRFLRAQRANEHLALPLIKYPKKKDKEAWMFFQVAECCHYLSQQSGTRPQKDSLVTLLTGSRSLLSPSANNGFSPLGIANTAGISIEHIETFHSKWKTSSKSHG
uniref:PIN domain-containing protein n=1 Tax=Homalodisca liturata TaxID=320908 RepID=A0A1B6K720_9HEMI